VRAKSYAELNAWLLDQCIAYARAHRHPEVREQTIWEMFEAERASLVRYAGRFDGFHAVAASVSKTCLVRFDNKPLLGVGPCGGAAGGDPRVCRADRIAAGRTAGG
jgi:hypothetical protein